MFRSHPRARAPRADARRPRPRRPVSEMQRTVISMGGDLSGRRAAASGMGEPGAVAEDSGGADVVRSPADGGPDVAVDGGGGSRRAPGGRAPAARRAAEPRL